MTDKDEVRRALTRTCSAGPFFIVLGLSSRDVNAYRCQACGAILKFPSNICIASWLHYKPGHEPTQIPEAFYKAFKEQAS